MTDKVTGTNAVFSLSLVKKACSEGLIDISGYRNPRQVADELRWSRSTVISVRDGEHDVNMENFAKALFYTDNKLAFVAPFLALFGLKAVPLDTAADDAAEHPSRIRVVAK